MINKTLLEIDPVKLVSTMSDLKYLINIELTHNHYFENYHPLALRLVKESTIHYAYSLFLLMKTLLRYSDMIQFDVIKAIDEQCFFIIQNKTGNPVRNSFKIFNDDLATFIKFNEDDLLLNSYDSLRLWIKKYMRSNYTGHKLEFSNKTHLFRHLAATFFHDKGCSKEYIKNLLGHFDVNSQRYYIHTI
jgi:hypothetical protein